MTPQLITASYSESLTVSFTTEAWFDAIQVAKSFKKQPKEWLRLNSTIEYIDQLIEFQRGENPTFPEFLSPITEPITLEDFNWRHQVISSAFQNLQNAKVVLTFNGSELLVGTRLAKTKRLF